MMTNGPPIYSSSTFNTKMKVNVTMLIVAITMMIITTKWIAITTIF